MPIPQDKFSRVKACRGRLLHLIHRDGPGGGPVVATQLLEGLKGQWDQSVAADGEGRMAAWCLREKRPFHRLPLFPLARSWRGLPRLVALLRREKPHVAIFHGQWAGPLGAMACRMAGNTRTVYIAHCPAFYHSNRWDRALRNYLAERLPLRWCDRVVVLSSGSRRNYIYRGWGPEEKIVQIPNGVDLSRKMGEEERKRLRAGRGWQPGEFHVVFAGRLVDQKRPDWMLESWRKFLAAVPELSARSFLHLVGDGPEKPALERFVREAGMGGRVRFAGEQDEAFDWMAAADLVAMTSLYEGHALVPLEAMLCGRPVLAMKVDGVEDSVEDGVTGILIRPGDTGAFAARLAELARDPGLRRRLGDEAEARVDRWDWQKSLLQYRNLLDALGPVR